MTQDDVYIHLSFNTASGRYYCNAIVINGIAVGKFDCVSIPQAVGTIAIFKAPFWPEETSFCFNTASGRYYCNLEDLPSVSSLQRGFNTASGRYYCNRLNGVYLCTQSCLSVSIPQAVGTIAILQIQTVANNIIIFRFNTASGRYYCNRPAL